MRDWEKKGASLGNYFFTLKKVRDWAKKVRDWIITISLGESERRNVGVHTRRI